MALENERLHAEAQSRLAEVQASRERIVAASDAERRRLERNLHDGAQQRLVALSLQLRLLEGRVGDDPSAQELVSNASTELAESLAELRELARGIHPAVLNHGLAAALDSLAARSPVADGRRRTTPASPLPEPVELAAYFVASEALTNVAKYAQATTARVRVSQEGRNAIIEIADDGVGGADDAGGSGLRGLADRVEALDGRLRVVSPPGAGTDRHRGAAVRVVIADDSVLVREGIAAILSRAGIEVAAQVDDRGRLLDEVDAHVPDIAIVDVRMPPTQTDEGLRAAHEIRARHPQIGIVILSQHVEVGIATRLLAETPEGLGYLLKDRVSNVDAFVGALERVADGGSALDPEVVTELFARAQDARAAATLTEREREVLEQMAEGLSNQAIAAEMDITLRSVEKYVSSVFTKLGLPRHRPRAPPRSGGAALPARLTRAGVSRPGRLPANRPP